LYFLGISDQFNPDDEDPKIYNTGFSKIEGENVESIFKNAKDSRNPYISWFSERNVLYVTTFITNLIKVEAFNTLEEVVDD
jgi:hypothetical protein